LAVIAIAYSEFQDRDILVGWVGSIAAISNSWAFGLTSIHVTIQRMRSIELNNEDRLESAI
jgi:hypothetical protein